jgi:hypothetical protein
MLATGMLLHERYSLGRTLIHHAIADLVAIGLALCPKPIGHRWRNHNKAAKAACTSHYG